MMRVLPAVLVLVPLLAAPAALAAPVDRPTRPAVQVLAFVGVGLTTLGLAFEITGIVGANTHVPVPEWRDAAPTNMVGGAALMGLGVSLIAIAALLTPWHFPAIALWLSPDGANVALRVRLP